MKNSQVQILTGPNGANIQGSAIDVSQVVAASFQVVNGDVTAAGTVKLQLSNDPPVGDPQRFTPTNWSDIPSATSTVATGVGPPIIINQMVFSFIRAIYTRTSGGTTTLSVNMNTLSG